MAIIPCPECKRRISETTGSCPKCGYELTPEKVEETKDKEKKLQTAGLTIGCLVPLMFVLVIFMCSQESSKTPIQQGRSTQSGAVADYKNKYRESNRSYEIAKAEYNQNPSASNRRAWDDATNKLDRAYLHLEKAMGAEPHKGVTKQRRELEAFIRSVKR